MLAAFHIDQGTMWIQHKVKSTLCAGEKKGKNRVFGPKKKVFFLSGIGGYPLPPLNGKSV